MNLKPVVWIGASYDDLLAFPEDVQDDLGCALYLGQTGELSDKAKPMRGALRDVVEIVASDPGGTYQLTYTVKLGEVNLRTACVSKKVQAWKRNTQSRVRAH